MFGGYTIEEAAQVLDTSEEIILETVARGALPTYRRFILFGALRISKPFVDSIAPDVRAFMQRVGGTRADQAKEMQERRLAEQQIEEIKESIEEIHKQSRMQEETFLNQFAELVKSHGNKIEMQDVDTKR